MAKKKKQTAGWGGQREGAGRPPTMDNPTRFLLVIGEADLEACRAAAKQSGVNVSEWMRSRLIAAASREARRKKITSPRQR